MICPNCKGSIKDESNFCPLCGCNIRKYVIVADSEDVTGPVNDYESGVGSMPDKPVSSGKGKRVLGLILGIVAVLVILALAALNVIQYRSNRALNGSVKSLQTEVDDLNDEIDDKDSRISTMETEAAELTESNAALQDYIDMLEDSSDALLGIAEYYNEIAEAASRSNIAYASPNFHCSTGIVVLDSSRTSKSINLTANWSYGGTVTYYNSDTSVAEVSFDEDSWYQYTTLTITRGIRKGVAIVDFTNSVDNNAFTVIVIVK